MSKAKKAKKPRPDKYAEKVVINASFDEVLQIFSDAAHAKVEDKNEEPAMEAPPAE